MKSIALAILAIAILVAGPSRIHAQATSPSAPAPTDDKQKVSIEKHLKPILEALKLQDASKDATVRTLASDFFAAHNTWHQANDAKLKELWNDFNHARSKQDKAAADKTLADIDAVYATFKPEHEKFLKGLATVLSPKQVAAVEDALTVNKVKVTYNAYLQIFPTLTDEQKKVVHKNLEDARDQAIDAGSMAEKSAFFKKYKIKIEEDYLTAQGYDPKQARKDFAAKGKSADASEAK